MWSSLLFLVAVHPALVLTGYTGELSCSELEEKVVEADKNTEIIYPPPLTGNWVSERCEVRAGPLFILRSHELLTNDTFRRTQYHYSDHSCSRPSFTVVFRGRYVTRGRSWLTPGATQVDYILSTVSVTAYNQQVADELSGKVNASCQGSPAKQKWRPHKDYLVMVLPEQPLLKPSSGHVRRSLSPALTSGTRALSPEETSCLSAVSSSFHEVGLLRVQIRPPAPPDLTHRRTELLQGYTHAPTAFQPPLLRADQAEWCEICKIVSRGSERSPPHLTPVADLPPTLGGEWLSARCETRPLGLFLKRRLRVSGTSWHAEYKFFSDSRCETATLTAAAEGYLRPAKVTSGPRVKGATDFDFMVERAFLTLYDTALVQSLQDDRRCGPPGTWQVGVTRDLTPSGGCAPLGITVPSVEYELVHVELDPPTGHTVLYLGHTESGKKGGPKHRPTAFQPPLLLCNGPELPPLSHLLNGYSSATASMSSVVLLTLGSLLAGFL